jgi:hypothetical protein
LQARSAEQTRRSFLARARSAATPGSIPPSSRTASRSKAKDGGHVMGPPSLLRPKDYDAQVASEHGPRVGPGDAPVAAGAYVVTAHVDVRSLGSVSIANCTLTAGGDADKFLWRGHGGRFPLPRSRSSSPTRSPRLAPQSSPAGTRSPSPRSLRLRRSPRSRCRPPSNDGDTAARPTPIVARLTRHADRRCAAGRGPTPPDSEPRCSRAPSADLGPIPVGRERPVLS